LVKLIADLVPSSQDLVLRLQKAKCAQDDALEASCAAATEAALKDRIADQTLAAALEAETACSKVSQLEGRLQLQQSQAKLDWTSASRPKIMRRHIWLIEYKISVKMTVSLDSHNTSTVQPRICDMHPVPR